MANDMMGTLKGLLGDNADEKIQSVLQALKTTDQTPQEESEQTAEAVDIPDSMPATPQTGMNLENMEYIMRLRNLVEEMGNANDDRSNLLLSLRPYMRKERQQGIDQAIRILNLSKFSGLFKL